MKKLSIFMLSMFASLTYANQVENSVDSNHQNTQLVQMTDEELSATQGQALYNLTRTDSSSQGLSFYRLGMEAEIAINANIKKLQLGCGGSKGAGCDIDIDNVALTGINPVNGEYAASDAILKNPFIEFAVKNADSSATREISGFRFGSLEALGKLSLGSNNNTSNISDDTGINSISGDLAINLTGGKITNIGVCVLGCLLGGVSATATVDDTRIPLVLNRTSVVSDIGPLTARASVPLLLGLTLTLTNVHLVDQPARAIHEILLQDGNGNGTKDFSLSLQKQDIYWPSIAKGGFRNIAAQKGWWLALPEVSIKNPVITQKIEIPLTTAIGNIAFSSPINIQGIDFGQSPAKNCYGSLKFC
ncbi:hypothetical protein [Acinetobacter sp. Marseille-Q1618]|uniref:hypothetical protein n=1 Tax=Acinetobacter sp. Marseille-Q1618 TaxID=2697502 RepID=UPI00156F57AB|nr:hypothetical protein [Acinetobacter sp. Marseille-Q1618]